MTGRIKNKTTPNALPIIGKLSIGEKHPEKGYPMSLDYFRAKASPDYCEMFRARYGEKPQSLTVVFPSDDIATVCPQFYELRDKAGKRVATGDGITFQVATPQTDKTVKDVEVAPDDSEKWRADMAIKCGGVWKEVLVLRVMLPNFPVFGAWELRTSGDDSSIPQIIASIDAVILSAGRLRLIPFDLSVKKVKSDKAGSTSVYPVIQLACNISPESVDKVRALPNGVMGILSEARIGSLTPSLQSGATIDETVAFTEYQEVLPETPQMTPESFLSVIVLQKAADFTGAAKLIAKELKGELARDTAVMLSDKAQEFGIFWNKQKSEYE